jgi:hypothetical protein
MKHVSVKVAALAALAAGLVAAAPSPAGAAAMPSGWNGQCHPLNINYSGFKGWCDGTGPESYGTYVDCSDGHRYPSGYKLWFGDRTGVYAECGFGYRVGQGYFW